MHLSCKYVCKLFLAGCICLCSCEFVSVRGKRYYKFWWAKLRVWALSFILKYAYPVFLCGYCVLCSDSLLSYYISNMNLNCGGVCVCAGSYLVKCRCSMELRLKVLARWVNFFFFFFFVWVTVVAVCMLILYCLCRNYCMSMFVCVVRKQC